jgi:hypothetical protein
MNTFKRITIILAFLAFFAIPAFGEEPPARKGRGGHHGPPPEAYTACEGKSAGDEAEFVSPHGDTVTGICEMEGDRLVLRPDHPKKDSDAGERKNSDG